MLSNEMIQGCIDDISEIMHTNIGVYGNAGFVASTNMNTDEAMRNSVEAFWESAEDIQKTEGYHFFKIYDGDEVAYVVVSELDMPDKEKAGCELPSGCDRNDLAGYGAGKLAVRQIGRLMEAYKEKFSRNQFIQNLLLDNLAGADVYNQCKLLGIEVSAVRNVFVIETEQGQDEVVLEMLRELYGQSSYDFVTAVEDGNIIVVKQLRGEDYKEETEAVANMLVDMINVETMSKVRVGYSNRTTDVKEVSRAFREAKMAVEVGKIFYSDKTIVAYNMLGIGRLIYQLPAELCDMFLEEVFGQIEPGRLDDEMLATINMFFEMNLNLSETARQMYVHRNTLAYRLERIEKMTGLDIRSFEDAMTFKLALMVADYRKMTGDS